MDKLLAKLAGVIPVGPGKWKARCPAHDDPQASLSIRADDGNGAILVNCFGGCPTKAVLGAVGLSFSDLFGSSSGGFVVADERAKYKYNPLWGKVYAYLLGSKHTVLTVEHIDHLLGRGMTPEEIEGYPYRSLLRDKVELLEQELVQVFGRPNLLETPGFFPYGTDVQLGVGQEDCLLIPVLGLNGDIRGIQVRLFGDSGPKYKSISGGPGGSIGIPVHVPPKAADLIFHGALKPLRITEGTIKANIATSRSGIPTVGIPGVNSVGPALRLAQQHRPLAVHIAFDRDVVNKGGVKQAEQKLADRLVAEGHNVFFEFWANEYKGIDDALIAGQAIHKREYVPANLRGGI